MQPTGLIWLLVAFVIGVLVEWLLEIFYFRRKMFAQAATERATHERTLAELHSQQATLEATIRARDTRIGELESRANQCQVALDDCAGARAKLEQELGLFKIQVAQLSNDLNAAQKNHAALDAELQTRSAQLSKLHLEVNEHETQKNKLLNEVAQFTAGATTSAAFIKNLEGDKNGLQSQIAQLRAELETANGTHKNLEQQVGVLQGQLAKVRADLDACHMTQQAVEAKRLTLQTHADQLRADLDACQAQKQNLVTEVAKLTTGAATSSALVQKIENEQAQRDAELKRVTQERDQLNVELATLRAQATTHNPAVRSADDETPFTAACPQHLSDVRGIGSVFEQRLYEAGIGSYWQLSQLADARLGEILQVTGLQAKQIDYDAIRADAQRLAKESKSIGRTWSQTKPDDFEPLEGIGHTFEKRLYDAGICTFKALAQATVAQLEEICHAPAHLKPDYALWIKQAQDLVAKRQSTQS